MNRKHVVPAVLVTLTAGAIFAINPIEAGGKSAKTTLHNAWGEPIGTVKFTNAKGHTDIRVTLQATGTASVDAFHGFHIHGNPAGNDCVAEPAALSNTWFTSVGPHWQEGTGTTHGGHLGDMPSVYVNADGSVETRFAVDRIDIGGLSGKAVVLHARADNFGNVPVGAAANQYTANSGEATTSTANTGNAGDRVACGIIG